VILDLHSHSTFSDDARATVAQYCKWIAVQRTRGYRLDGFVLTEHRGYDEAADYAPLARAYDLLILKATELDTNRGHFLVYGVNPTLRDRFDFRDVTLDANALVEAAEESGALAVPAHPGRFRVGFLDHLAGGAPSPRPRLAELLNGASRPEENARAAAWLAQEGLPGIAGSDAHFANRIGHFATAFPGPLASMPALVEALKAGDFRPLTKEETRLG